MAQRIVVVGGGFAGLWSAASAARTLSDLGASDAVEIVLVTPGPSHVIRVRCYESDLGPIAVPLDDILGPIGVRRIDGSVTAIDPEQHRVTVQPADVSEPARALIYDRLVLAAGSALARPPIPGADGAFDVDTLEGARRLADHLAYLGRDPTAVDGLWTAVIVGAGLVGIEIACEMPARLAAARDRAGVTGTVRTILIDHAAEVGQAMGGAAMPAIRQALTDAGVECLGGVALSRIDAAGVTLSDGTRIAASTVICATGMRASPLAGHLGVPCDRFGRVLVASDLRVAGIADVYAAGDIASALADAEGHRTVMSCQHARPMGRFAGHNAVCDLVDKPDLRLAFSAPDYVTVLDLGDWGAVYTAGWDRARLVASGASAKATKQTINASRIYPPLDRDRAAILAAAAPIVQAPPGSSA